MKIDREAGRKNSLTKFYWFIIKCSVFDSLCVVQKQKPKKKKTLQRHTAVSGFDHMLIFRSGKPQYLVSQPSSFLTCSMEKKCSPIHLTALHRSLPQSPRLSFSFSHIPSLLFAHLNALSPEFLCSASYICLIFASNSLGFQLFLSSVFSYFLHKLSSPPPGPHTRSILLGFARPILLLFICSCV